jgi:Rhodopirellula transposase DDE domain
VKPNRDKPKDSSRKNTVKRIKEEWEAVRPQLDERRRRQWAAKEARKIGPGGIALVFEATRLSRDAIRCGIAELDESADQHPPDRVRAPGGGRKSLVELDPELRSALDALIEPLKKASKAPLRWTCKGTLTLAQELSDLDHTVGARTVAALLHDAGYDLRATASLGADALSYAETLFSRLNASIVRFHRLGNPVITVEVSRRTSDGDLKPTARDTVTRSGPNYRPRPSGDYPLRSFFPDGIPDPNDRVNWREVEIDQDTAAFAAASIREWWRQMGKRRFGKPSRMLIATNCTDRDRKARDSWRIALQGLANDIRLVLEVCDLPAATIKWRGIEHCFMNFTARSWRGKPMLDRQCTVRLVGSGLESGRLDLRAALDATAYPPVGADVANPRTDPDVAWIIEPKAGRKSRRL